MILQEGLRRENVLCICGKNGRNASTARSYPILPLQTPLVSRSADELRYRSFSTTSYPMSVARFLKRWRWSP